MLMHRKKKRCKNGPRVKRGKHKGKCPKKNGRRQ